MANGVITFISFAVLLLVLDLIIKKRKPNWVNYLGLVLTSLFGAGFISELFAGSTSPERLVAILIWLALGIFLLLKKNKNPPRKKGK
ncbi:MAG: hypothetical protein Q8Q04_01755 [archaeon]|nr:hypothetical protein [archaeon]